MQNILPQIRQTLFLKLNLYWLMSFFIYNLKIELVEDFVDVIKRGKKINEMYKMFGMWVEKD